ncbi:glycosyltransferase family 1 protein [bacterium]|nr:glycosyltransferase family 1 protein [bacterium]
MSGRDLSMQVKVLHVIKTLGLGGAESNLLNLACAFDTSKVETHVAYSGGGEIEAQFQTADVLLYKYAEGEHRVKSLATMAIVYRLAKYIQRNGINIVHTHNFNAHVWGSLATCLTGVALVEHVHDQRYTPREELLRCHGALEQFKFAKYFRHLSDRVVVLTRKTADAVVRRRITTPERVVELRNGIPLIDGPVLDRHAIRQELDIPDEALVILTCARIEPAKNIQLILSIASEVRREASGVVFLVAGSGTHLETYRRECEHLGLTSVVRFIGYRSDITTLMAGADIFLLPSFLELHSVAVLEALRMGLPVVISTNVGCNDEYIKTGWNGYLCDPFNQRPWIDTLVQLANDAELRKWVGMNGRRTCYREFDIRATAAAFEELYMELCLARGGSKT